MYKVFQLVIFVLKIQRLSIICSKLFSCTFRINFSNQLPEQEVQYDFTEY